MGRVHRIETSDGLYHVINRGNYRSQIFETDGAKKAFEKVLWEACERFRWDLLAYVLMSNHFHLCLGTPSGKLSAGMQWLQGTFAKRFNRFRGETGHLFQGRFKSLIVEPGRHLLELVDYIHLNPSRAGLCQPERLGHYRWSSLYHFPKRKRRPGFLCNSWMDYEGTLVDDTMGWRRYLGMLCLKGLEDPKDGEETERRLCRGWCISSRSFKKALAMEILEKKETIRLEHDELDDYNQTCWEVALEACLKRLGYTEADASVARYSEPWKLAIASRLKRETSVTNAWLTRRLSMGVPNSVSNLSGVYRRRDESSCVYARKLRSMKYEH